MELPWCATLGERIARDPRISGMLPHEATAVQCTLFTKSTETNWAVPLHQDLSVPVARHVETSGWSTWSEKEGQTFVQPPLSLLQEMLAIRLHIDACDANNGALRVIPGSHQLGRLNSTDVHREHQRRGEIVVSVPRGGAMLMRPLLLHASSRASADAPRRVLHFLFGPSALPDGIRWPRRSC